MAKRCEYGNGFTRCLLRAYYKLETKEGTFYLCGFHKRMVLDIKRIIGGQYKKIIKYGDGRINIVISGGELYEKIKRSKILKGRIETVVG